MARKGGLGQKGLNLLISQPSTEKNDSNKKKDESSVKNQEQKEISKKSTTESYAENKNPLTININEIEPNRNQPRKNFDDDSLHELADSIKTFGVIEPLIVQKKDDYYEIIAGERRWRAARLAGLKEIPVLVREYTDREVMEISLIENIQREDLNPIEEANAFKRLIDEYQLKQDELAVRLSKSRSSITNSMRLLKLDKRVQDMLVSEMITSGHARTLLSITDPEEQYRMAQNCFDQKMSVRELEKAVKKLLDEKEDNDKQKGHSSSIDEALNAIFMDMEEKMRSSLGTKVRIQRKSPDKGKIEIEYYSKEELERLYDILRSDVNYHGEN